MLNEGMEEVSEDVVNETVAVGEDRAKEGEVGGRDAGLDFRGVVVGMVVVWVLQRHIIGVRVSR